MQEVNQQEASKNRENKEKIQHGEKEETMYSDREKSISTRLPILLLFDMESSPVDTKELQ